MGLDGTKLHHSKNVRKNVPRPGLENDVCPGLMHEAVTADNSDPLVRAAATALWQYARLRQTAMPMPSGSL